MTTSPELPDILADGFAADPYSAYGVLRENAPLFWHEGTQSYVISRYEDVARAFRDPVFTTANYDWQLEPVHGRTILQLSGREPLSELVHLITGFFPLVELLHLDRHGPILRRVVHQC
jgi:cytochrome P450